MVGVEYRAGLAGASVRDILGRPGSVVELEPKLDAIASAKHHVDIAVVVDVGPQARAGTGCREGMVRVGDEPAVPRSEE